MNEIERLWAETERQREALAAHRIQLEGALTMLDVHADLLRELAPRELAERLQHVQTHTVLPTLAALDERTTTMKDRSNGGSWYAPALDGLKAALGAAWYKALVVGLLIIMGIAAYRSDDPLGRLIGLFERDPVEVEVEAVIVPVPADSLVGDSLGVQP